MRLGLALPSFSFPDLDFAKAVRLHDFAQQAEARSASSRCGSSSTSSPRAGFYGTAWLSPLEVLSYAAGATSRIKLATGILIPPIRNPIFLAKELASLVFLSGGRFELGIGVGWDAAEFQVAGVPLAERGGRTDEILGILGGALDRQEVTHGRYYQFPPLTDRSAAAEAAAAVDGRPIKDRDRTVRSKEVIAPSVLERICRRADGWLARAAGTNAMILSDWAQIAAASANSDGRARSVTFGPEHVHSCPDGRRRTVAYRIQRPLLERVMGCAAGRRLRQLL